MGKIQKFKKIRKLVPQLKTIPGVNHYRQMKKIYVALGVEAVGAYCTNYRQS